MLYNAISWRTNIKTTLFIISYSNILQISGQVQEQFNFTHDNK